MPSDQNAEPVDLMAALEKSLEHPKWVKAMDSPGVTNHCNGCDDVVQTLYRPWGVFDLDRMYCADCSVAQDDTYEER